MAERELKVKVRWMLVALEAEPVARFAELSKEDIESAVKQPDKVAMVAEAGPEGRVVGFLLYQNHRGSIEILNVAVHDNVRRRGVATQLIDRLKAKLGPKRDRITLEISEQNLEGQLFFKANGFLATKVIRCHGGQPDRFAMRYCRQEKIEPECPVVTPKRNNKG
jgi:ribosomal-protein-alanine N-acetyltransferase